MDNITVTDVNWYNDGLTDSAVTGRLAALTGFVDRLFLGGNSLTQIPALTQYREMETLQKLYLLDNQIQTFVWDNVPTQVWYLNLGYNRLQSLPVLDQEHRCLQVRELYLQGNSIQSLQPENIPGTVEKLDIDSNHITQLGDFSHFNLTFLDLWDNDLSDVNGDFLPTSLEKLLLWGNSLRQIVNLTHLVNLTKLWVPDSDCQAYRQMLPSVTVYKRFSSDPCP